MFPRIVFTWCATARGGAERSVPELATELAASGLPVTVVWWRAGDGPGFAGGDGVEVHEVTGPDAYADAVARTLGREGDAVVIGSHRTMLLDLRIASPRVPVIAVVRGILHPDQAFRVVDPDCGALVEHTPRTLPWGELTAVGRWVGISQASAASVRAVAPAGTHVSAILNGVSVPEWRPPVPAGRSGVRLVAVCRSVAWKRLDVLIDAVAAMRHRDRVHLDVYGEAGSEHPRLEHRVAALGAPVTFHGWAADLARHLAGAHALVSASDQEGFGRGVLDAAGVAVPAIVPTTGANPELVLDGITGHTYDPTDPTALTELLDRVAETDPGTLAALGWAARRRALGRFAPARCADEYLELCHTLLAHRQPVGAR